MHLSFGYFDFSVNGPGFLVMLDLLQSAATPGTPEPGMGASQRATAEENFVRAVYTWCDSLMQRRKD